MEGIFIVSATTSQLLLSSRFSPSATYLLPLALEALKTSDGKPIIWFPALSPARKSKKGKSRAVDEYDEISSEEESILDEEEDATTAWATQDGSSKASSYNGACVCHVKKKDLKFAVAVSQEIDPVAPFAFLNAFISILEDYFGPVSEAIVKDSFDVILQMFEEMFDPPRPKFTDASALRELVPPLSLYTKVLNAATSALSPATNPSFATGMEGRHTLSSPIPWRRSGIKYQNQEVYFDVVEEIGGIVDKNGNLVTAEVLGRVDSRCRLSGMPDLLMQLSNPDLLQDCCFHPCVRLQQWGQKKSLSFIPPDGRFILMEYRLATPTLHTVVPLSVRPIVTTGSQGGAFHLTITSRAVPSRPLENVSLSFKLGVHVTSVQATLTGGKSVNPNDRDEASEAPSGRWEFKAGEGLLRWRTAKLSSADRPIIFTGTWSSRLSPCPLPDLAIAASFSASLTNISGIQISALKIASTGDNSSKPYKGVRPMLRSGKLEFRWQ